MQDGRDRYICAIRGVLRVGLALGEGNVMGSSVPYFNATVTPRRIFKRSSLDRPDAYPESMHDYL